MIFIETKPSDVHKIMHALFSVYKFLKWVLYMLRMDNYWHTHKSSLSLSLACSLARCVCVFCYSAVVIVAPVVLYSSSSCCLFHSFRTSDDFYVETHKNELINLLIYSFLKNILQHFTSRRQYHRHHH